MPSGWGQPNSAPLLSTKSPAYQRFLPTLACSRNKTMPLHPVIHKALSLAAGSVPYHAMPIAQARAQARQAYRKVD
eukprot:gene57698-77014_t